MSDPRFPGHCFVCGKETFNIIRRHKEGPLKGEPAQIGKPLKNAMRCELLLMSGRRMPVTVHDFCVDPLAGDLPKHWKTIMGAFRYEETTRHCRNVRVRTQRQQQASDDFMAELVNDVPLGVLSVERVQEMAR